MRLTPAVLILLGLGIYVGTTAVAAGVLQVLDLDGDGLSTWAESGQGTHPWRADSDADGLSDGWETERGLLPLVADADGDGLLDGAEVAVGADPASADTDADGLPDAAEDPAVLANADCDGDGRPSIREQDDDADQRLDADEEPSQRCVADTDEDGVLDGHEANATCVATPDCDSDGLGDLLERNLTYDPLDPDTFDANLPDSVAYAFAQAGQQPGADDDDDGIPDPWEDAAGLIDWGPYNPAAGQRDLLVEFVRATGPDSGSHPLDLAPSYELVRAAFADNGIRFQYQSTTIRLPTEPAPSLIPTRNSTYYRAVLDQARFATNPFVVTVVVNPQLDQSEVAHAGVAPIRGMLAAVDLSQYVELEMEGQSGDQTVGLGVVPYYEGLIRAGRILEVVTPQSSVRGGGVLDGGRYYLDFTGSQGVARLDWSPFWFKAPRLTYGGQVFEMTITQRTLETAPFASVLMHEIGHTLGLCHPHEATCNALLPPNERPLEAQSTMSYNAAESTLAYLPSEWGRVRQFLACPAPDPIQALADGESTDVVLDAKYDYALESLDELSVRNCRDFTPLQATFEPLTGARSYDPPAARQAAPAAPVNDATPSVAYWLGAVVIGLVAGATPAAFAFGARGKKFL